MGKIEEFDDNWKFHFGDIVSIRNRWAWGKSGSWNQGPESSTFDDSEFISVTLPHDFVIETQVYNYSEKEFGEDNTIPAMEDINNIHTAGGSFDKQVGWYRKHFYIPKEYEGKKIYLIFDGIYRNSSVFLNDFYIGGERSGYTKIRIDITDFAAYGEENVLAVKCDAREAEGWFYEGGGIYRHAYLEIDDLIHMEDIYIQPEVAEDLKTANIKISGNISFIGNATLVVRIYDSNQKELITWEEQMHNERWESSVFETKRELQDICLWSENSPYLYSLKLEIVTDGKIVDTLKRTFGVRKIYFDSQNGFFVNNIQTKLKGVCCHQNHGGLGTAVPNEVFRYRIKKIKEMGANAYRCSHYPMCEAFYQICDEEGIYVMAENRLLSSEKGDLHQLESLVKIARNHACVILYSIGNEEAQSQSTKQGGRIAETMIKTIKQYDSNAYVTMALLMWDLKNKKPILNTQVLADISEKLDVAGFNYHENRWEEFREKYPNQPFICTEQGTFRSTRGCYVTCADECHLAITDKTADTYMKGAEQWRAALPDWVSGLFIWTGFDYYGEPTPYAWPAISSQFGAMDLCGFPKDFYYFYKAWWTDCKVMHVFPDMNQPEGTKVDYHVFSNADEVELILNGNSLGKKKMLRNDYLVWENVTAQKGTMIAIGYRNGKKAEEKIISTAGKNVQIKISREYKENDISIYKIEKVDEYGNIVPDKDEVYEIPKEYGYLLGAANGNPSEHIFGKHRTIKTFHGLAQFIVMER